MKKTVFAIIALVGIVAFADDYPAELNGPESTPLYSCPAGYQYTHSTHHGLICGWVGDEGMDLPYGTPRFVKPVGPVSGGSGLYCPGSNNFPQTYYQDGKVFVKCSGEQSSND